MSERKANREITHPRYELVDLGFITRVAETMTRGAVKYGEINWQGFNPDQQKDIPRHAFVHIAKFMEGDTSEDHLGHAAANIMMAMHFQTKAERHQGTLFKDFPTERVGVWKEQFLMAGSMAYLAGPIDAVTSDESHRWRSKVSAWLNPHGVACYWPNKAFSGVDSFSADKVRQINQSAIINCDYVLAYLPDNTTTVGTPMEIEFATKHGIPVLLVSSTSFIYLNPTFQVKDLDELAKFFNNGLPE